MAFEKDKAFKDALHRDPRALLHLVGRLSVEADAVVKDIPTELIVPGKIADGLLHVTTGGLSRLELVEAVSWWKDWERVRLCKRTMAAMMLEEHEKLDLAVTVLLMLEEGLTGGGPPYKLDYDRGGGFAGARVTWVVLPWIDASVVLDFDFRNLMHLVPLMRHTVADMVEAGRRIAETGDENMMALYLALGARRYDRDVLRRWLKMMERAIMEIGRTTWFGQDLLAEGRAEGMQAGIEKGRQEGARDQVVRTIRTLLRSTHPNLADHAHIDLIQTPEQGEQILTALIQAKDEEQALAALAAPLRRPDPVA
jgi:hypothetical protein